MNKKDKQFNKLVDLTQCSITEFHSFHPESDEKIRFLEDILEIVEASTEQTVADNSRKIIKMIADFNIRKRYWSVEENLMMSAMIPNYSKPSFLKDMGSVLKDSLSF
jgi:hypothetical protein